MRVVLDCAEAEGRDRMVVPEDSSETHTAPEPEAPPHTAT
jgi:hypothetical protein